jgi:hypothetical protein
MAIRVFESGEIFDLEKIAEDCAADKVYEFMFVAPPLPITGAVGSPIKPSGPSNRRSQMASPVNWLIFELVVLALVGVVALLVARAASKESKSYGINGQ